MTAADLQRVTGVDVLESDIVNQLRNNVKVDFNPQAGTYAYKVRRTLVSQCLHAFAAMCRILSGICLLSPL
jgi:hypothetical protein